MKRIIIAFIIGLSLYSAVYSMITPGSTQQQPPADVMALLQQHEQTLRTVVAQAGGDQNPQVQQAAQQVKQIEAQITQLKQTMMNAQQAGDQPPAQVKTIIEQHQQAIQNLITQAKNSGNAATQATANKLESIQNELRTKMSNASQSNQNPAVRQRKLAKKLQ